jgi:membrane protease subunit HflC
VANFSRLAIVLVFAAVVVGVTSIFTVHQWERALKFRFGEFSGEEIQPGLHFKWPFVNTIEKYDTRIQTMDKPPERFFTIKKEELLVDSFVKWKIADLQKYFKTVKNRAKAENRLQQKINNGLKAQIAKRSIRDIVAGDRIEIMEIVQKEIDDEAKSIGVEVIDVRLKRVDLADSIRGSVFERMRSERERIANEKIAEGNEQAIGIKADADRQKIELVAEAEKNAQIIRGEADALATKIFADSFGQNAEFYEFYRSLSAYKRTFNSPQDLIILDPDSDFFKHFNSKVN